METFTIIELSTMIVSVMGAVAMCCAVISKSRCDTVNLCCGLINIHRKVPELDKDSPKLIDKKVQEGF